MKMWLMDQDLRDASQGSIPLYAPVERPGNIRRAEVRREGVAAFAADLVEAAPDPDGARVRAAATPGSQLHYEYRLVQLAGLLERATGAVIPMVAQEAPIAIAEGDSKRLDAQPGAYYATAQVDGSTVPLAGPYASHGQALLAVAPARQLLLELEAGRRFGPDVAFGTTRCDRPEAAGFLNDRIDLGFSPMTSRVVDEDGPVRQYLVSVSYERWTQDDYDSGEPSERGIMRDREMVDEDDLLGLQRGYGFSAVSASRPDGHVWFQTTSAAETREHFEQGIDMQYALHIHAVDGRDVTAEDIQRVGDLLRIRFDQPLQIEAETPEP